MIRSRLAWPFVAIIALLVVVPLGIAAWLSLTDYTGIRAPTFTGWANVERLVADDAFWRTIGLSALLALLVVPLRLALATTAALLLHRRGAVSSTGRVAVYLPSVVPDAAWALLWLWILNPLYGPLPALLRAVGVGNPGFITTTSGAVAGLALVLLFQVGEAFVVALAARGQITPSLYEVAAVEGIRPRTVVRRVTLPLMAPVLGVLALRDVVVVLHASFVPALLITGREPLYETLVAPLAVYRRAFLYGELGYASLMSLALFAITSVAVALAWSLGRASSRGTRRTR